MWMWRCRTCMYVYMRHVKTYVHMFLCMYKVHICCGDVDVDVHTYETWPKNCIHKVLYNSTCPLPIHHDEERGNEKAVHLLKNWKWAVEKKGKKKEKKKKNEKKGKIYRYVCVWVCGCASEYESEWMSERESMCKREGVYVRVKEGVWKGGREYVNAKQTQKSFVFVWGRFLLFFFKKNEMKWRNFTCSRSR